MAAPIIVFAFLVIVFAPCLLAFVAWNAGDSDLLDEKYTDLGRVLERMGNIPAPLQAALPELPIGGEFEIRSFPKGLSQRRMVVRDMENAPRLTITQVRQAAAELARMGASMVAHELALVAAALVAAGRSAAAAAREAIEAAHDAIARRAWAEAVHGHGIAEGWGEGPPRFGPARVAGLRREESAAA